MCLPLPEAPPKPKNDAPVHESTPWPGTGKMSGNLFEDRNWLLPPNYLDNNKENKTRNKPKAMTSITSPKPLIKEEESKTGEPTEKYSWGPGCPFCKSQEQKEEQGKVQPQKLSPKAKQQASRPKTLNLNMTKAKQQWEEKMERLNFLNIILTVTPIQNWIPNQMKMNNTAMNMAMKCSYEKFKNEFVRLIFAKTSFSKPTYWLNF